MIYVFKFLIKQQHKFDYVALKCDLDGKISGFIQRNVDVEKWDIFSRGKKFTFSDLITEKLRRSLSST